MSLREGNEGFKTRIPRPAVVASPAPCAVEAPPARATAAAVKSAVAAAVRPVSDPIPQPPSMSPHPVPETPPRRARARSHPVSDPHPAPLPPVSNQSRGKGKENAPANNAATGTKRKPMAPTVTTNAPPAAKKPNGGGDASSPMDFDPEYEELIAMKLATKDTKYDFKAQIAVAKDFSQRAKALMRTMRDCIGDVDVAVAAAKAESAGLIENALGEAEDAARERDVIAQSLDAARAEAQASAAQLAAAAKRETAAAKAAEDTRRALDAARKAESEASERATFLQTELAPLREELASITTAHRLLQEQASGSIKAAADANEQVAKLLSEKATVAEEQGRLRGELTSTVAQLESARHQAQEHEKDKARVADEANRLHADLARTKAEKDASNEQLARTREDVHVAKTQLADVNVELAEAKARANRLEDSATHLAADLARARADVDSAKTSLAEANLEIERLRPALALAEEKIRACEREYAAAKDSFEKEISSLKTELASSRAVRDALEPRVEQLGAELAEARAEAKVAKAESEHLRKAGDEARERGAGVEKEREAIGKEAEGLRSEVARLEGEKQRTETRCAALEAELTAARADAAGHKKTAEEEKARRVEAQAAASDAEALQKRLEVLRQKHDEQSDALAAARAKLSDAVAESSTATTRLNEREETAKNNEARLHELERLLAQREAELRQAAIVRRALHNAVQELKGNVRVFCRVRPPANDEDPRADKMGGGKNMNQPLLKIDAVGEMAGRRMEVAPPGGAKAFDFNFDRVFGQDCGQGEVFEEISHLVQSALDGYKVCIFTYGQTGSGKTYTMLGGDACGESGEPEDQGEDLNLDDNRGLIPRSIEQIFKARDAAAKAAEENRGVTPPSLAISATMIEIYNEDIKDLLVSQKHSAETKYDVKHHADGRTTVTGLKTVEVANAGEVAKLMKKAQAVRSTAKTNMNEHSSRSHMVFTLHLDGVDSTGQPVHGALNLVDLAGSERLSRTGAEGARLKEAQCINKSLSALGDVVLALANRDAHVPFRNSKLTYLLQNSLGGDSKTLMFVNVSPAADSSQETLCSLRFAAKVNSCSQGQQTAGGAKK